MANTMSFLNALSGKGNYANANFSFFLLLPVLINYAFDIAGPLFCYLSITGASITVQITHNHRVNTHNHRVNRDSRAENNPLCSEHVGVEKREIIQL